MDLEEQIRRINNSQEFVKICNTVFMAMYETDFQVIDGTRSDHGNDGYISSEKRILAIHCPVKPEKMTDKKYLTKIYSDLEKAAKLRDSGKLVIEKWTFVIPYRLSNDVFIKLKNKATQLCFEGSYLEATFLANELYRSDHLIEKFPSLHRIKLDSRLANIEKDIKCLKEAVTPSKVTEKQKEYKESEDKKKVLEIMSKEQTESSKNDLKSIFYKTSDKDAQINAILGLLNWFEPSEDKDEDMVEWCNQGISIAKILDDKSVLPIFLASKGRHFSSIWFDEDMLTAFYIKAGNTVGIPLINEAERQEKLKTLRSLEAQFTTDFKEALEIAMELKNGEVIAQVCILVGSSAGERYIHVVRFNKERAITEKTLAKKAILIAKHVYEAMGSELGVGYAIHNLANQLDTFGEKDEAMKLTKKAIQIAQKYGDASLLQTAMWLEEKIKTGKIPDYVHGERRERKK